MNSFWIKIILGLLVITQWGCASLTRHEGGSLRDSELSNYNPAPSSMAPPHYAEGESASIDPLYMRSQADYHFTMGEAYALEGKTQKALESFKLTLVYDPKSPSVRLKLATEYVRQGLVTEAIEQSEEALKLDPKNSEARMVLGSLYSSLRMYDQALAQYKALLEKEPDHLRAPVYIGAILAEQQKYDEAAEVFERLAKNPKNEEPESAYFYMGRIRSEQKSKEGFRHAEKALNKALSLKPKFADAVLALDALYRDHGQPQKGLRLMESFQDKFGPNNEIAQALSRVYLQNEQFDKAYAQLDIIDGFEGDNLNVKIQMALILIESEKFKEAATRLEEILTLSPDLDKIRYYLGAVYEETNEWARAIENYSRIPASSVYFSEAVVHTAFLFKKNGNIDQATNTLTRAISQREDIPQFYTFYASLLDDKKEYKKAVTMLSKAAEKFPEHVQINFFLGTMHDRVGHTQGTIQQMRKVLELDSGHVQALNYLAYTYAELNQNLAEAEELARKALQLKPSDAYVLDTMGWILFKKGEGSEALKYLELAYKTQPEEAIIAEHLGDAYYRQQLVDKAIKMYNKALTLEADNDKVRKIRDKIASIESKMGDSLRTPASQSGR